MPGCNPIVFSADIGGINSETFDSKRVFNSPQLRKIAIGTTDTIPMLIVPENEVFRLKYVSWSFYSAQGKQDLTIILKNGSRNIVQTGKLNTPIPVRTQETRTSATVGMPYSKIGSTSGIGYPDNFMPSKLDAYTLVFENETLKFVVQNQSDVYPHAIKLDIGGWLIPVKGRSKEALLKSISSMA